MFESFLPGLSTPNQLAPLMLVLEHQIAVAGKGRPSPAHPPGSGQPIQQKKPPCPRVRPASLRRVVQESGYMMQVFKMASK